jgi:hypothetical protein
VLKPHSGLRKFCLCLFFVLTGFGFYTVLLVIKVKTSDTLYVFHRLIEYSIVYVCKHIVTDKGQ